MNAWGRASFLKERRVGGPGSVAPPGGDAALQDPYHALLAWREGMWVNEETFLQRLKLDGLDEEGFLHILAGNGLDVDEPASMAWTSVLDEIRARQHAHQVLPALSLTDPARPHDGPLPLPFSGFLHPFLQVGAGRLSARVAGLTGRDQGICPLERTAETELLNALARRLLTHCTRALVLELNVARLLGQLEGSTPQARFDSFSDTRWRDLDNVFALLEEYPVLARLMATSVDRWVETTVEFLDRFLADRDLLSQTFCQGSGIGVVTSAETGLSDLHRGGHSVVKVRFSSGARLVYKPRSLAVEARFQQLLGHLNALGLPRPHRLLGVLDRETHGWVELARAAGCASREEVGRFYWRQGSYLALLYVLKATDFHLENLIACGEHPILVDLEALLHHEVARPSPERAYERAVEVLNRSVLRTGLLPLRILGKDGRKGVDLSGLGGEAGQLLPRPVAAVEDGYTDTMRITGRLVELPGAQNRPRLGDEPVKAADFAEEIVDGFRGTYDRLRRHRDAVAQAIRSFADIEVRHIARPSRRYALFLQEGHHPDYLRDGLDRDRLLDKLWAQADVEPTLKRLVRAEQHDLRLGDIPFFTARPGHRHVWDSAGNRIPHFFETDSVGEALARLAQLDDSDREEQVALIRSTLVTLEYRGGGARVRDHAGARSRAPSRDELLQAAVAIGETLAAKAVRGRTDACWIGVDLPSLNNRVWQLAPAGTDLYGGVAGMALFLGYLGAAARRADLEALARAALEPVRHRLRQPGSGEYQSIGAFSGLASGLYALPHLARLWDDASLLEEAVAAVGPLAEHIPSDQQLDIIGGAAGCAAVLLDLYEQTGEPAAIDAARRCGERLLETAVPRERGCGWLVAGTREPLAGFSHGASGIAWALLRLAHATGDQRFADTAHRGLAYERTLFVPDRGNWRDLRTPDDAPGDVAIDPDFIPAWWCHGAPGVALGRLLALRLSDSPRMREEAIVGAHTTLRDGFGESHCLCHGDLGNLDTVLFAEEVLGRDALGGTRWQRSVQGHLASLASHIETGQWRCGLASTQVELPGLMLGLAGVGYGLLRLWSPATVPSVLRLEPPCGPLLAGS